MVKSNAAARASCSVLHASMFCATYPPPPGSEPGYQEAHQFNPRSAARVMIGTTQTPSPLGQKASAASADPNGTPDAVFAAPSFASRLPRPPIAFQQTTASTIAPPISKQYCTPSATATPQ